jgi:branched-subunit amino acid ABC-type transport system permease component
VLVFAVTRVIFIPQGEFVAYGALTLASAAGRQGAGHGLAAAGAGHYRWPARRGPLLRDGRFRKLPPLLIFNVGMPLLLPAPLCVPPTQLPLWAQVAVSMLLVVPLGPMIYRVAFQPLASAPVLVLLIVSVAVHLAMIGLGLLFFGAEGSRTPAFTDISFELAGAPCRARRSCVVASAC